MVQDYLNHPNSIQKIDRTEEYLRLGGRGRGKGVKKHAVVRLSESIGSWSISNHD